MANTNPITVPDKVTTDTLSAAEFTQILDALKSGTKDITALGIVGDGTTLYVDSGNNKVGIGTSTPQETFEAQGGFKMEQDPTPGTDHTLTGIWITATADEALVIGDVCILDSAGLMVKADATASSDADGMLLMASETVASGATGEFLAHGFIRDDTWTWTVAGKLYVSETAGNPTQTIPTTSASIVRILGYAFSADVVYFNPDHTYVENA